MYYKRKCIMSITIYALSMYFLCMYNFFKEHGNSESLIGFCMGLIPIGKGWVTRE